MIAASHSLPDDCPQAIVDPWWVEETTETPQRGELLWAFVLHVDATPRMLEATGRAEPTEHTSFEAKISTMSVGDRRRSAALMSRLPVAALPRHANELWFLLRGKIRPVLVLAGVGEEVPKAIRRGSPNRQYSQCLLVAPYYGGGSGWPVDILERVKRAEYSRFHWDFLPPDRNRDSVLRFDQAQPVGADPASFERTGFRLTHEAAETLTEWFDWFVTGELRDDGMLALIRQELTSD